MKVSEVIEAIEKGELKDAFGTGTAATIAQIKSIAADGTDYVLPDIKNRELSNKLLKTLDDIKLGKVADNHNWIVTL